MVGTINHVTIKSHCGLHNGAVASLTLICGTDALATGTWIDSEEALR